MKRPAFKAYEVSALLAAIVDSSDDAIVSKTLEGIITSWNHGAEKIFGYSAAEAIGQHITFIIPPERRSEEDDVLAQIRRGEKGRSFRDHPTNEGRAEGRNFANGFTSKRRPGPDRRGIKSRP